MNGLLAIAWLTVVESLRKRVFLGIAGFGAAFLLVAAILPSMSPAARVSLLQAWAYRLILFFGVLVALVLAAFSVPEDIETRRIQTLLVKPVRRSEVLLGKFLGFLGVMAVFIALMGGVGLAVVRVAGLLGGAEAEVALEPDFLVRASGFEAGPGAEPSPYRAETHQRVAGPVDRDLRWRFDGVTRGRFGEYVTVRMRVRLGLVVPDPMLGGEAHPLEVVVESLARPGEVVLRIPVGVWTRRWTTVTFPVSAAEPGGAIRVHLHRPRPEIWMAGNAVSMELVAPGGALALETNFVRALVLIYIQVGIVLGVTLAVSLFASALVTLVAGFFFFLCGSMAGFLRDALVTSELVLKGMLEQASAHAHSHRIESWDFPPEMVRIANGITKGVLHLLPDFSQLDYSSFLVTNHAVSLASLFDAADLVRLGAYLVGSLGLACAVAAWKEFTA
jgi:hypothetical protein